MSLRAGSLRTRVLIEEPIQTRNSLGEAINSWTSVASRWAHVLPLRGSETDEANQQRSGATHKVTIRFPEIDIRPDWRLRIEGSDRYLYLIQVYDMGEIHEHFMCTAEERYS